MDKKIWERRVVSAREDEGGEKSAVADGDDDEKNG